jgi:hypothetical protein
LRAQFLRDGDHFLAFIYAADVNTLWMQINAKILSARAGDCRQFRADNNDYGRGP